MKLNEIRAVFFDVGETLVREDRMWRAIAEHLVVPTGHLLQHLDTGIRESVDHNVVLSGIAGRTTSIEAILRQRHVQGHPSVFEKADLNPDAIPTLQALKDAGFVVGIAGNQPAERKRIMESWDLPVDVIRTSEDMRAAKPSPHLFNMLAQLADVSPEAVAYVGDRLDNDVMPVSPLGMTTILLRRGPWGTVHADLPEAAQASLVVDSLTEIPAFLLSRTIAGEKSAPHMEWVTNLRFNRPGLSTIMGLPRGLDLGVT